MNKSLIAALFAALLAIAAPAPLAESLTGQEQESVCDVSRPSRGAPRIASSRTRSEVPGDAVQPSRPSFQNPRSDFRVRLPADGIPPILSRPPPR